MEITDQKKTITINGVEKEKQIVYRHTVTDDLDVVDALQHSKHFCVMAPISYAGKTRVSTNARIMYALGVELDNLIVKKNGQQLGLENLIDMYSEKAHWLPKPTFIVASGNGLHLYYQFERPLVLFPNTVQSLKLYKTQLTKMLWNKNVTTDYTDDKIQQESIFQGFRMPGTPTRKGDKAVAFRVGKRVSIEYMNSFMYSDLKGKCDIEGVYKSKLLLKDAKELYPEWHEKVIVKGDKTRKEWAVNRAVYDWWLRQIKEKAIDGHRYHCIMMLSIYAIKCGNYDAKKNPNPVTQEEFEADAWSLLDEFNERGKRADNPFTEHDIMCAIQVYEDRGYITYPIGSISHKSGIEIKRNERNYQKQEWHLEDMRNKKAAMKKRGQQFKNPEGRPLGSGTKEQIIKEYRLEHPEANVSQVAKALKMSRTTVYKWWDEESIKKAKSMAEESSKKAAETLSDGFNPSSKQQTKDMKEAKKQLLQMMLEHPEEFDELMASIEVYKH